MKSRSELKRQAKDSLKGNWKWALLTLSLPTAIVTVIYMVAYIAVMLNYGSTDMNGNTTLTTTGTVLAFLILVIFSLAIVGVYSGITKGSMDLIRNQKQDSKKTVLFGFTPKHYTNFLILNILIAVFTFLWRLLLVIPGIIKGLAYSQAPYVMVDRLVSGLDGKPLESITRSRELMDGHKWRYFVLQLSFIGWAILASLSAGIGYFFLIPYVMATNAAFYDDVLVDKGLNSFTKKLDPEPSPQEIVESKEEIVKDVPLMGQPEVKDVIVK